MSVTIWVSILLERLNGPQVKVMLLTGECKRAGIYLLQEPQRQRIRDSLQDGEEIGNMGPSEECINPIPHVPIKVLLVKVARAESVGILVDDVGSQPGETSVKTDYLVGTVSVLEMANKLIYGFVNGMLQVRNRLPGKKSLQRCPTQAMTFRGNACES